MSFLVTGSLAYDYLLHIEGKFINRLPEHPEQHFAAAFLAPRLARAFGGCAGNISYGLARLGAQPLLCATAGNDFTPYADHLHSLGISTEQVLVLPDFYTAQAYMVTDEANNQIIVFHPGATAEAHRQDISHLPQPELAIVAPNGKDGMLRHCRALAAADIPFIFDPGQAIGSFSATEMLECMRLAPYAIFNKNEFDYFSKTTEYNLTAAAEITTALFITHSEEGSEVLTAGKHYTTDCVHLGETRDPTGCGDAFRAGLMFGLERGWSWQTLLEFSAIIAAVKATHHGGQSYPLSYSAVEDLYQQQFSKPLP